MTRLLTQSRNFRLLSARRPPNSHTLRWSTVATAWFALGFLQTLTHDAVAYASELAYGGRLTETSGKPLDGPVMLKVRFYFDENGGQPVGPELAFVDTTNFRIKCFFNKGAR